MKILLENVQWTEAKHNLLEVPFLRRFTIGKKIFRMKSDFKEKNLFVYIKVFHLVSVSVNKQKSVDFRSTSDYNPHIHWLAILFPFPNGKHEWIICSTCVWYVEADNL